MKTKLILTAAASIVLLSGCAVQDSALKLFEGSADVTEQKAAQEQVQSQAPAVATLKRKIALGRITNETTYGSSLLLDKSGDRVGKQVSDMLAKNLVESGHFTVLERTDLAAVTREEALSGNSFRAVGADILLIGSVTEFGRKTIGERGFLTSTKRQVAFAKMDVRVVDTSSGLILFSCSGAGEASTETGSSLFGGSRASYDGTLNDKAISQAVSEVINQLVTGLKDRPWRTFFLSTTPGEIAISGGASQGLKVGQELVVKTRGRTVKSKQTGFDIELPGKEIARLKVTQTFGNSAETEGSLVQVISGSIKGQNANKLVIEDIK